MDHHSIGFFIVALCAPLSEGWNYEEQDRWPGACQSSIAQSPIDLDICSMVKIDTAPLTLVNWNKQYEAKMKNNGHSVQIDLSPNPAIIMMDGGLPGEYKLLQFHFHWGSEHTLKGQQKALEAHFVTLNRKYNTIGEAANDKYGVAVLAVLYENSESDNVNFNPIMEGIPQILNVKQEVMIRINPLKLLPGPYTRFYRYYGSLTTPNCDDIVVWTIFSELPHISRNQVNIFSSIMTGQGKKLTKNFRKVQPLNGRQVYRVNPVS